MCDTYSSVYVWHFVCMCDTLFVCVTLCVYVWHFVCRCDTLCVYVTLCVCVTPYVYVWHLVCIHDTLCVCVTPFLVNSLTQLEKNWIYFILGTWIHVMEYKNRIAFYSGQRSFEVKVWMPCKLLLKGTALIILVLGTLYGSTWLSTRTLLLSTEVTWGQSR